MGDPLSISASVAGLISLGLSVSSGLIDYYGAYKDSQDDIATMHSSVEALSNIFKLLNEKVLPDMGGPRPMFSRETVDRVTESIITYTSELHKLRNKLNKAKGTKPGLNSQIHKAQWSFKQETLKKLQSTVTDLRDNLGLALDALQIETATSMLERIGLIDENVDSMISRSFNEEEIRILKWLSPLEPHTKQLDVLRRHHEGTGRRMLESPEFMDWKDSDNKVLWCPGIPGAGKTILSSVVIDHLQRTRKHGTVGIAYVYCIYNDPDQTVDCFLGSLLQQLAQQLPATLDTVKREYKKHVRSRTTLPTSEILRLLQSQTTVYDRVYIVVDALDECPENDQTRKKLLDSLRVLGPKVHLLVTSRDIASTGRDFRNDVRMDIRANDKDVRSFIKAYIAQHYQLLELLEYDESLRNDVVELVLEKAKGMFLLAALHMDALTQEDNVRDLKECLRCLPEGVNDTYKVTLKRIYSQNVNKVARAEQVLDLINCAMRPLQIDELLWAVTVRPNDTQFSREALPKVDAVLSACCGLVVTDEKSGIVRLVHYSAEEFFKRTEYKSPRSHGQAAGILLTYLNFFNNSGVTFPTEVSYYWNQSVRVRAFREDMLLDYAAEHWGNHVRQVFSSVQHVSKDPRSPSQGLNNDLQSGRKRPTWDIDRLVVELLNNKKNVTSFTQISLYNRYPLRPWPNESVPDLWLVAGFGIVEFVKRFIDRGDNPDEKFFDQSSLEHAAENGHIDVVRLLSESNASVYKRGSGYDALRLAMGEGHSDVAYFLLGLQEIPVSGRHFELAASLDNTEMLDILATQAPNPLEQGRNMGRALREALRFDIKENSVRYILHENRVCKIPQADRERALVMCAGKRRLDFMKILLETNIDVNAGKHWSAHTALTAAIAFSNPHIDAVKLLLKAGAAPDIVNEVGATPLGLAVKADAFEISKLLVEQGANLETAGSESVLTPLGSAVMQGSLDCVRVLLQSGADPRSCPPWYANDRQALEALPSKYQEAYNIVMNAQKNAEGTPLDYAIRRRQKQTGLILLCGVNPASYSPSIKLFLNKVKEADFQRALDIVQEAQRLYHDKAAYESFVDNLCL